MIKILLNKLFGFRWALYVLRNNKELCFALHSHNVGDLLGYIGGWFENYGEPKNNFSFALNFNKTNKVIHLEQKYFKENGKATDELWHLVLNIDKNCIGKSHLQMGQFNFINVATGQNVGSSKVIEIIYDK